MSRLVERATFLYQIAVNASGPGNGQIPLADSEGDALDPQTPSRCDWGGPVNPSLPYAQLRIEFCGARGMWASAIAAAVVNRLLPASSCLSSGSVRCLLPD